MRLLLFPIKSEPGVVYKSVAYKKGKRIERPFVHEEITFHHDFLLYLIYKGGMTKKGKIVYGRRTSNLSYTIIHKLVAIR